MKQPNEQQQALVHTFAKLNKISHSKLDALMKDVFAAFPQSAHKGRQMKPENVQLIEDIKQRASENPSSIFTIKELSGFVHSDPATTTNALKKLEKEGKAFMVGTAVKDAKTRGKAPKLWSFKAPVQEQSHE